MKSGGSSLKIRHGTPDTNTNEEIARPAKAGRAFLLPAPCPQKIKPASKKNPYRLQGLSGARSYLQGSTRVRPLSAFIVCRGAWCLNERPRHEDRRHLPRYRHHSVGICVVVLEMAPNQDAGKFVGRDS
jgi:hypothetical protein